MPSPGRPPPPPGRHPKQVALASVSPPLAATRHRPRPARRDARPFLVQASSRDSTSGILPHSRRIVRQPGIVPGELNRHPACCVRGALAPLASPSLRPPAIILRPAARASSLSCCGRPPARASPPGVPRVVASLSASLIRVAFGPPARDAAVEAATGRLRVARDHRPRLSRPWFGVRRSDSRLGQGAFLTGGYDRSYRLRRHSSRRMPAFC